MKYVPSLLSIDAEIKALQSQNFSNNVMPFIQIVKDKKREKSDKSVLDDLEKIISSKQNNDFILTIPRNYNLSKKLKSPIKRFFIDVTTNPIYIPSILNRFSLLPNVIPTIEIDLKNYTFGSLRSLKDSLTGYQNRYCYRVYAKTLDIVYDELKTLITDKDFLLYDLDKYDLHTTSIKREKRKIKSLRDSINFKTIVIKQIYKPDFTFNKFPDGKIVPTHDAYDYIDFDFYDDFKNDFNYFGDWAGIRSNAMYDGGRSYPTYLTIEMDTFDHHGFKGIALSPSSFGSTLLPNYIKSNHWNTILTNQHKSNCYGCTKIIDFINGTDPKPDNATKWKAITISHFIDTMDYKISNSII